MFNCTHVHYILKFWNYVRIRQCHIHFFYIENYEPGDENLELAEMLLDLKENTKMRRRVDKGIFAYILIKDAHSNIFQHVEASIISFPTTWMVESGFSAAVDVFSRKRNKLELNSRGTLRLRLNDTINLIISCVRNTKIKVVTSRMD